MGIIKNPGVCAKSNFQVDIGGPHTTVTLVSCRRYSGTGVTDKVLASGSESPCSATRSFISEDTDDESHLSRIEQTISSIGSECAGICYWCDLFEPIEVAEEVVAGVV